MQITRKPLLDAEDALVSTALFDAGIARQLCDMPPAALLQTRSRTIQCAIKALLAAQKPVDLIAVSDELERMGEDANLAAQLAGLSVLDLRAQEYADMLLEEHERRRLEDAARHIVKACLDGEHPADIAADGMDRIRQSSNGGACDTVTLKTAFERMRAMATEPDGRMRVYTGIPLLDHMTGGIRGGKLVIVGARPGVGKSVFGLQTAIQTAMRGGRVLLCSLEMDEREVMARMASHFAPVTAAEIEKGNMDDAQKDMLDSAWESICRLDIRILTAARSPAKIRREARRIDTDGKLALVVVDYLGLMESGQRAESRRVEVGQISRALKQLAMDLQVPVMALSQLNRQSDGGKDTKGKALVRPPSMAELRDSGDVEQDANMVLLLHKPADPSNQREDVLMRRCEGRGTRYMVVTVEKNRQGESNVGYGVEFDGAHSRITRFNDA